VVYSEPRTLLKQLLWRLQLSYYLIIKSNGLFSSQLCSSKSCLSGHNYTIYSWPLQGNSFPDTSPSTPI
jgi:hypothetical protein